MNRILLFFICFIFFFVSSSAQSVSKDLVKKQSRPIKLIDDDDFSPYYVSGPNLEYVYNMYDAFLGYPGRSIELHQSPIVSNVKLTVLSKEGNRRSLLTDYIASKGYTATTIPVQVSSFAYTPDGRQIVLAYSDSTIHKYDALRYSASLNKYWKGSFKISHVPEHIQISPNMYFLAYQKDKSVFIWNFETGKLRKEIQLPNKVHSFDFSNDNTMLAVSYEGGSITVYDTRNFEVIKTITGLGKAGKCHFHNNGKYIAVQSYSKHIYIINLMDDRDRVDILSVRDIKYLLGFIETIDDESSIVYTIDSSFVFHKCESIKPNRQRIIKDQIQSKLSDWSKQRADETSEQYRARVNEENLLSQARLFEYELTTSLAGALLDDSEITFGGYSSNKNLLTVNFNTMPSIYLEVPENDVTSFSSSDDLIFANTVYGLNEKDNFVVLYTEVINKLNGKTYVYDNNGIQTLNYMSLKDDFVPIDVIMLTSSDQIKLEEIREEVMNEAKQENLISDHTNIHVNSNIESSSDADGKRIYNYHVKYSYDVDMAYTNKDDYRPGRFTIEESQAALAMLQIVRNAFEGDFSQYVKAGKKLQVSISGTADGTPIVNKYYYKGEFGQIEDELMHNNGDLSTISIMNGQKLTLNEELAFLRAQGVRQYVVDNIPAFTQMDAVYDTYIEVSEDTGSQYRRIGIEFTFIDAF